MNNSSNNSQIAKARRGSYTATKVDLKNDDLMKVMNSQTSSQSEEEEMSPHPRARVKRSVTFIMDRNQMTVEQRQVYDLTSLQVKLVKSFPNYVRQAEDFTFIRMIGKGGFGHVWVANDLKTGNVVAIKELHRIDGRRQSPLLRFIREVQSMIQVKSRFTLPIYGFTAEQPFSIIMPLMTGNTLNDLLQKKQYTFSNLNIYAICIARGLKDIHKAGIVYRDLKATNILMDHDGIPIICDFGTARVYTKNTRMTLKAGTFCFMAPEVYNNPYYDQKCDVHSYGSLLYEMSELSVPLKKMDDNERLNYMLSGQIAQFHKERTPKPLRKLITRCWDLDPQNRPDWDEIIELFETGKVYFRNTNILKVKHFVSKMKEELDHFQPFNPPPLTNQQQLLDDLHDHLFKNRLFKNILGNEKINDLIIFQKPTVKNQIDLGNDFKIASVKILDMPQDNITNSNDDEIEEKSSEEKTGDEDNDNSDDINLNEKNQKLTPIMILRNPDLPEFPVYLDFLSKELQPRHFIDFYQGTLSYIRGYWDCPQIPLVFHCYESLVRRNQKFLDLCVDSDFFKMISKKTLHFSMGMVSLLVHYKPQLIDNSELNLIINLLQNDPYETIYILGEAANNHSKIKKLIPLFDSLLEKYQLFFEHQTGEIFLGIFYTLYTKSDIYKNARMNEIKNLFVNFLNNESSIHKLTAINAICNIYDSTIKLSFDTIMKLFSNHCHANVRNSCISLLMRMKNYPVSHKFCNEIIDEIPENSNAFYILLKFASEGFEQSKMLLKYPKWMLEYITVTEQAQHQHLQKLIWLSLQLFMLICLNHKLRKKVVKKKEFPGFIKNLFLLDSRTAFVALNAALKKMSLNQSFVDRVSKEGVIDLFIKQCYDPKMSAICIMTLQTLVINGYSEKYELLIPMSNSVLNGKEFDTMAKKAALQFLCVLSSVKNMIEKIKNCRELMQFVKNDSTPELSKYLRSFNQIIGSKNVL
ncbi:hypothetical protein M9Y10_045100 [Tritrichomonas musculus]|uniref:Protein kinase domain-containing protein n=1 Tax=Tritrichomonas musculus TaxID=1915356 RepID=A0ABR2JUI4_9EUKA